MKKTFLFICTLLLTLTVFSACTAANDNQSDTNSDGTVTSGTTSSENTGNDNPVCKSHSFGEWTVTKKATCTAEGSQSRTCSVCGAAEKQSLAALGHTEVDVPEVPATCTAEGKSAGKRCSVCTRITVIPQKLAKLSHTIENGYCTVCGNAEQSEGLVYELSDDGTYYILTGYGSCTDSHVIIPAIYNGLPVKEIGNSFATSKVSSVSIPDSITKVASDAFSRSSVTYTTYDGASYLGNAENPHLVLMFVNDSSASSFEIHSNTRVIVEYAFKKCKSLTEITIPENVRSLGYAAFSDCSAMTKVNIVGELEMIEGYTFYGCTALTSVTIPDSVKVIGSYAFSSCSHLNGVTLPKELTEISSNAFFGCASLESIVIPDKVTKIWGGAFSGCRALTSVVIGGALETLDVSVFESCPSLKCIKLGSSFRALEHLYNECFDFFRIGTLTEITVDKNNQTLSSKDGVLFNKDMTVLICYPKSKTAKSYPLPSSVREIADNAFYTCGYIESVSFPSGLEVIGDNAFHQCVKLNSPILPSKLRTIGASAFYGCSRITAITLPESLVLMSSDSFASCNITYLREGYCDYLGSKSNPHLVLIEMHVFESDSFNITVNPSTKIIASSAARQCYSLKSVSLPEGLITIGNYAFSLCQSLEAINIPSSVTYIGNSAFAQCSKLTEITLSEGLTFIGKNTFEYCSELTGIIIPDSVLSIGESAFSQCRALACITLSKNLESIGKQAFHNCKSLKAITIPASVTYLDKDAFSLCDGIKVTYE